MNPLVKNVYSMRTKCKKHFAFQPVRVQIIHFHILRNERQSANLGKHFARNITTNAITETVLKFIRFMAFVFITKTH